MEVRNCRGCTRLFNYISGPNLCPECRELLEKKFQKVKEFVREHPAASMQEVAEENDVSCSQITQWVREERLEFSSTSPITIACERCGASIRSGRFCSNCKNNFANAFSESIAKPKLQVDTDKKKGGDRMFHL